MTFAYLVDEDGDHREPTWRDSAACRGLPIDLFFPVAKESPSIPIAKNVCEQCPVQEECLEYALDTNQRDGIWGGLTSVERRRLKRRRREQRRRDRERRAS